MAYEERIRSLREIAAIATACKRDVRLLVKTEEAERKATDFNAGKRLYQVDKGVFRTVFVINCYSMWRSCFTWDHGKIKRSERHNVSCALHRLRSRRRHEKREKERERERERRERVCAVLALCTNHHHQESGMEIKWRKLSNASRIEVRQRAQIYVRKNMVLLASVLHLRGVKLSETTV